MSEASEPEHTCLRSYRACANDLDAALKKEKNRKHHIKHKHFLSCEQYLEEEVNENANIATSAEASGAVDAVGARVQR